VPLVIPKGMFWQQPLFVGEIYTYVGAMKQKPSRIHEKMYGLFVAVAFFILPAPAYSADFVAHKAFYGLKMGSLRPGSDFVSARGNMSLSIEKTCDGWSLSQTLLMDLGLPSGDEVKQDLRYAGWESNDGKQFRFFASNKVDDDREDFRGRALLDVRGGPGNARFNIPEERKIPLPSGTLFPLSHTAWLIERAKAGVHQASGLIFDGADGDAPQHVTAFISEKHLPKDLIAKGKMRDFGDLNQSPGWSIRMAFYPLDSTNTVPDYEVEVLQLENGVTPHLVLDYDDFSVVMNLEGLKRIADPEC